MEHGWSGRAQFTPFGDFSRLYRRRTIPTSPVKGVLVPLDSALKKLGPDVHQPQVRQLPAVLPLPRPRTVTLRRVAARRRAATPGPDVESELTIGENAREFILKAQEELSTDAVGLGLEPREDTRRRAFERIPTQT